MTYGSPHFIENAIKDKLILACLLVLALVSAPVVLYAQDMAAEMPVASGAALPDPVSDNGQQLEQASQAQIPALPVLQPGAEIVPDTMPSVLFNIDETALIQNSRREIGLARPATEQELQQDLMNQDEEKIKPPPEKRYIRLGGIVYVNGQDWTIWLNEQRVTPNALPREVLDLKVFKEFIEIKWFDDYSNQIFPIRLRPHQRFNIDTRIFLPG